MADEGCERDLSVLVVPEVGRLETTGDRWVPYRLLDANGGVVGPAAAFFAELQGMDRRPSTIRSYGNDLLRWWRFLAAIGVRWDRATPVEGRDFARWMMLADKPFRAHRNVQQLPASPDSFVWLRLYQEEIWRLGAPRGRRYPLWFTLRRPWRQLSYPAARAMFTRAQQLLGSNWTIHDLRHTASYRMSNDPQMNITDVQWILGHACLTTTQLYTTPSRDEVIASVLAHHARQTEAAASIPPPPASGYNPRSLEV